MIFSRISDPIPVRAVYIEDVTALSRVLEAFKGQETLGLDTETTGLDPYTAKLCLIQIGTKHNSAVIRFKKEMVPVLQEFFNSERLFVAHNAVFDYKFLEANGILINNICCTLIAYRFYQHERGLEGSGSLKSLMSKFFGRDVIKGVQVSDWEGALTQEQFEYAALDPCFSILLWEKLKPFVPKTPFKLSCELIKAVSRMELNGIGFDAVAHREAYREWSLKVYEKRTELEKILGDKVTNARIANYLEASLPKDVLENWPRTKTGILKTDSDVFSMFPDIPVIRLLQEFSHYLKLCSTYGERFTRFINPVTKRIHPNFLIQGTRTGRMSSQNPNGQNMPRSKDFRRFFIPAPGAYLIIADYSQIEVRVAAEISKDPEMLKVYREGLDIYLYTASKVLRKPMESVTKQERQINKQLVLGLLYGLGANGFIHYLRKGTGVVISLSEAQALVSGFRNTYRTYYEWQCAQAKQGEATLVARTILGKIRKLEEDNTYGTSMNVPIQGTASEILSYALINCLQIPDVKLCLTVHDEILLESTRDCRAELEEAMRSAYLKVFPQGITHGLVEAQLCKNWSEKA
jgi:DNA polymerase I-like protein with 3'-5' exonuclease and polymerase domains